MDVKSEKVIVPMSPALKATLRRAAEDESVAAYIRRAIYLKLAEDGFILPAPADANIVPVVTR